MRHTRKHRRKAPLLLRLRRRQRKRAHGAPVKCAKERDHVRTLGVVARQLQRGTPPPRRPSCHSKTCAAPSSEQSSTAAPPASPCSRSRSRCPTCGSARPPASEWPPPLRDGSAPSKSRQCPPRSPETRCHPRLPRSRLARVSPPWDTTAYKTAKYSAGPLRGRALAFGPGRAVLIFGPATGIRVLVVMVFSCEMAGARRTCRISCLPAALGRLLHDRTRKPSLRTNDCVN